MYIFILLLLLLIAVGYILDLLILSPLPPDLEVPFQLYNCYHLNPTRVKLNLRIIDMSNPTKCSSLLGDHELRVLNECSILHCLPIYLFLDKCRLVSLLIRMSLSLWTRSLILQNCEKIYERVISAPGVVLHKLRPPWHCTKPDSTYFFFIPPVSQME